MTRSLLRICRSVIHLLLLGTIVYQFFPAGKKVVIDGIDPVNSITDDFCSQQKEVFGDTNYYQTLGGMAKMGDALDAGMVLALSVWDDYAAQMLWLDSDYPTDGDASKPGVNRGPCPTTSGQPAEVEAQSGSAQVTYSNIKFGPIGSTFSNSGSGGSAPANPPASTSVSSPAPTGGAGTVAQWGQCGGIGYAGPTACASPFTCHAINDCKSTLPYLYLEPNSNSYWHLDYSQCY